MYLTLCFCIIRGLWQISLVVVTAFFVFTKFVQLSSERGCEGGTSLDRLTGDSAIPFLHWALIWECRVKGHGNRAVGGSHS